MKKKIGGNIHISDLIAVLPRGETEHMRRVGILVGLLTERAYVSGLYKADDGWIDRGYFERAAFYHDIGKVWIPHELLTKTGMLTTAEERVLRLHPMYAQILRHKFPFGEVLGIPKHLWQIALQAAEYHHERWDGKGYPYGLHGQNIPLIARLTAICDAYDTITSKRAYKEAFSHEVACRELRTNAGSQFDPLLTSVFLKNENEFAQLKMRLPA